MDDVEMIDLTSEDEEMCHSSQSGENGMKSRLGHLNLIRNLPAIYGSNGFAGADYHYSNGNRELTRTLSPEPRPDPAVTYSLNQLLSRVSKSNVSGNGTRQATHSDTLGMQKVNLDPLPQVQGRSYQAPPPAPFRYDNTSKTSRSTESRSVVAWPTNSGQMQPSNYLPSEPITISDDEEIDNGRYRRALSRVRSHEEVLRSTNKSLELADEVIQEEQDCIIDESVAHSALPSHFDNDDYLEIVRVVELQAKRPSIEYKRVSYGGTKYNCSPGKCVEFSDGSFIKIKKVVEDENSNVFVVGQSFRRHNDFLDHKWPRRHNELVLRLRVKDGTPQSLVKRPLTEIMRNRVVYMTNQSYSAVSARTHKDACPTPAQNKEHGPLFARWKQTCFFDPAGKILEESIERLSFIEADLGMGIEDIEARLQWRGRVIPGGEYSSQAAHVEEHGHSYKEIQKYTFGDTFCGGGGASCGADQAGLFVKFGVDFNEKAMQTYRLNYQGKRAECREEDIHDFIQVVTNSSRDFTVDVLHISPPCQPFSPAHTVANQLRDEVNEAAIFAVGELLRLLRPRVVTLEETFGLQNRHKQWFDALIKMFIDPGYSIRWKIAKLEEHGLAQKRRRLLIIAAGPGEALPPFPAITHSETRPNLKPLRTIRDAIGNIPPRGSVSHHDIQAATYPPGNEKTPYSMDTQAKTITTSGGIGNHHPSGLRMFTIRELAALQNFPLTYKFPKIGVTELRRQIGNAVPPYVFKKIYREIILSLKKTDGKV